MIVFSFSLYGTDTKYTEGMIRNAAHIPTRFPTAEVWIYIAPDVPVSIRERLAILPHVKLIDVERKQGSANMFDRFLAVDDPATDIMFVRDADSRVHERDAACIEDFLAAPDKQLHIVRDHRCHRSLIMGGIWGIRRSALTTLKTSMSTLLTRWNQTNRYMDDQNFLSRVLYPLLNRHAMIHDRCVLFEPKERLTPFRVPIVGRLFVGQVHLFREDGTEYADYEP